MPLANCEINLILTWYEDCVISSAAGWTKFAIAAAKLYIPVLTLSAEDNMKLFKQLESGFNSTTNWSKYQSNLTEQKQYLTDV